MLISEKKYTANNNIAYDSLISSSNANELKQRWEVNTSSPVSSDPIVYGNHVYFTDWDGYAYCVNKRSGKLSWKIKVYSPPTPKNCGIEQIPFPMKLKQEWLDTLSDLCLPYIWNGLAATGVIYKGIWYMASVGGKRGFPLYNAAPGKLYAMDIKTQKILFETTLTTFKYGGVLAKVLRYKNTVYVGVCGMDEGLSLFYEQLNLPYSPETIGSIVSLDMEKGEKNWEIKTIGLLSDDQMNAKGVGVWSSMSICPEQHTLFFVTGKNYGTYQSKSSNAIVAVNCENGSVLWQNRVVNGKIKTLDEESSTCEGISSGPQLFDTLNDEGISIPAVGIISKGGYYYVFDRRNGELIWSCLVYNDVRNGIEVSGNAVISDGVICVCCQENTVDEIDGTYSVITCLNATSGEKKWQIKQKSAAVISTGVICNDVYTVGDILGNLYTYHLSNGLILGKKVISNASISSNIIANDDNLYVGVGLPKILGGQKRKGVIAFGVEKRNS